MALSLDDLPDDVETLKALIIGRCARQNAGLAADRDRLAHEQTVLTAEVERLTEQNERLRSHHRSCCAAPSSAASPSASALSRWPLPWRTWRPRSVPRTRQPRRRTIDRQARGTSKNRRANRGHLPAHLPREEVIVEPEAKTCPCCGGALHVIGEDVLRAPRQGPGQAARDRDAAAEIRLPLVHRRGRAGAGAEPAGRGRLPTEALVADVLVAKYADHLPLYRQAQIFAREGVQIDRSTLAHWVGFAAVELEPLHARLVADPEGIDQAVRRRDALPGARSGAWPHQDRLSVGHRSR